MQERFYKNSLTLSVKDISGFIDCEVIDNGYDTDSIIINNLSNPENAKPSSLIFVQGDKDNLIQQINQSKACVCLLEQKLIDKLESNKVFIIVKNAREAYAMLSQAMYNDEYYKGIHPTAVVEETATIGTNVSIGANVYIGHDVEIGNNCKIKANAVIAQGCIIGDNTVIKECAVVQYTIMGKNCVINQGSVLGSDGFGYASSAKGHTPIKHLGIVELGDYVDVGANCTIDRGTLLNTKIGSMTKLDNLVHLAHNVELGNGCLIAGQVGMAGSAKVGNAVVMGGQAAVTGHISICDNVHVAGRSGIYKTITQAGAYRGNPAKPMAQYSKNYATLSRIIKQYNKDKKTK